MGVNTKAGPMPHISFLLYRLLTMSHKLTAINYNTHLSKAKLTQLVQDEVPPLQLLLPGDLPGVSQLVLRHRNMVATVPWASCNNISHANYGAKRHIFTCLLMPQRFPCFSCQYFTIKSHNCPDYNFQTFFQLVSTFNNYRNISSR